MISELGTTRWHHMRSTDFFFCVHTHAAHGRLLGTAGRAVRRRSSKARAACAKAHQTLSTDARLPYNTVQVHTPPDRRLP